MPITIESLRQLLALDPADATTRFALGNKLVQEGTGSDHFTEAVEHLEFARQHDPKNPAAFYVLAQALIRLEQDAQAASVLREGIAVHSRSGHAGHDLVPEMTELLATLGEN